MSGKALWVPLDVNFLSDPAILACSPEAQLLYVRSLCLAKQIGSNGLIDKKQVAYLCFGLLEANDEVARTCQNLLDEDLWIDTGPSYEIRSWAKYNKSPEEIEKLSQARREAGRKGGRSKAKQGASDGSSKVKQSRGREEKSRVEGEKRTTTTAVVKSEDAPRLAQLLANLILARDPKAQVDPVKWAPDIDLLIRKDGREPAEVEKIIRWCQSEGCFWRKNILSGKKLRIQFTQLVAGMQERSNGRSTANTFDELDVAGREFLEAHRR